MQALNLPKYEFNLIHDGNKNKIFDPIRKAYFVLTPEEWVRQNFIRFLIEEKGVPAGLMAIEKEMALHQMKKRMDILCYSKDGIPLMMVECKAPKISITQKAFDQIGRYNISQRLPYLIVTNGIEHYCAKIDFTEGKYEFLKNIPSYHEMLA
ncbi:MAG: restriction endonuclease subunit R [Verrucomicrobia bacterium]|nr:restriction endonuclease subunit R [Verrucomicrobiota bacterium]|tara:strand:+ start:279 stop:734 length:456 start_codon:yes stop_codon:yes gene_type:complete